ncbi:MAG TPA: hypothetical protein VNO81_02980, partial [Candidatus Nitrosotenuis sp.]|nr:hypothetical protein [Candidatus Nitrosotenuis sp.]
PPLPPDREPVAAGGRLSLQGGQGVARPGASGPSGTIRDYEDLSSYMRLQREARQAVPLEGLAGGLEPVLFGPLARPA